jgi:hypothetical protein
LARKFPKHIRHHILENPAVCDATALPDNILNWTTYCKSCSSCLVIR